MGHIALDGFWLVGALALAWLVGIFTAQYIKDKVKGVPSPLRTALQATETAALNELEAAKAKVVSDVAGLFAKAKAATPAAPVAAKPVAAAPVAAAPVAAAPVTTTASPVAAAPATTAAPAASTATPPAAAAAAQAAVAAPAA